MNVADDLREELPGSISVSVIAPAAYLREFAGQSPATVHHVAAQRVLRDPAYREFFLEEQQRGAAIIIDNGVFDLGVSLGSDDLVLAARAVRAEEIILPDVMHDGPATIRASDRAAAAILGVSDEFRLCAVVHGADDAEWRRCYDHFAASEYAGALAFPASRHQGHSEKLSGNRAAATRFLEDQGLVDPGRVYRLLGFGWTGHLELFEQREHAWVSSIDGAAPVLLGAMGVRMRPHGPYEKIPTPRVDTVEKIDPARFSLIRDNIRAVRYAANSAVEIRVPQ
jgi:hypothetical protein